MTRHEKGPGLVDGKEVCLDERQKKYLNAWMNKVSRSFALVTPCFEKPLDDVMALAYLMCRVVDNIEDCTQPLSWKRLRYLEFSLLLKEPANAQEILSVWEALDWPGLTSDETKMMSIAGGQTIWQIYAQIPQETRSTISHWCSVMSKGMEDTEDSDRPPLFVSRLDVRVLARKSDYDLYCYYVAGTVGHMISDLAVSRYGFNAEMAGALNDLSDACGRGLQKTNIVKDFAKDLARGICYLPEEWMQDTMYSPLTLEGASPRWKQKVLEDVLDELEDFVSYITVLPYETSGYRLACLMCVLPAFQTILKAARNHDKLFTSEHDVKISRITFLGCIKDAQLMVRSNEAILRYSHEVESEIDGLFAGNRPVCMIEDERVESCSQDIPR